MCPGRRPFFRVSSLRPTRLLGVMKTTPKSTLGIGHEIYATKNRRIFTQQKRLSERTRVDFGWIVGDDSRQCM